MKIKIESDKHGRGKVWIDGKELKNVRSVNTFVGVDMLNTVQVEVYADHIEVDIQDSEVDRKVIRS